MDKKQLQCQRLLQEFLDGRDWEDELSVNN